MGIRPSLLVLPKNASMPDGTRLRYPPTFFVQMARDVAMADWIALDADKLKSQASISACHHSSVINAHAARSCLRTKPPEEKAFEPAACLQRSICCSIWETE